MLKLTRHVEIPRTGTHKQLKARYPDYTIYGDSNGYHWPVEQTKTVVVSLTFKTLIEAVKKHLTANDVVIPIDLERSMNEFSCAEHPTMCEEIDPDSERKVSLWYMAKKFFTAVISAAVDGLVPQEEAERRALICSTCPNNQPMEARICEGCWSANFVREAAEKLSTRHTSLDNRLDTCSLCQCRLSLKCHVRKEAMADKTIEWPEWCWMKD